MQFVVDTDSWLRAAAGGGLIGLAAGMMIIANGRIAGISGVLGGLFFNRVPGESLWRLLFLAGMVAGAAVMTATWSSLPPAELQTGWLGMAAAGLIVGYGTRMGSGCTSGHGVCGIARLSTRSILATVTFMAFGVITVFVTLPNTKIELLEPLGEGSPIAKFLERNADGGIHHLCYEVDDIIAARDRPSLALNLLLGLTNFWRRRIDGF